MSENQVTAQRVAKALADATGLPFSASEGAIGSDRWYVRLNASPERLGTAVELLLARLPADPLVGAYHAVFDVKDQATAENNEAVRYEAYLAAQAIIDLMNAMGIEGLPRRFDGEGRP